MNVILLSGGSGKRLWPLSNGVRSKQFLRILNNGDVKESMLQRTHRLISAVDKDARVVIATAQQQVPFIKSQLDANIETSIEPCRRDTFPAIVLACAFLESKGVERDQPVVVCPVDSWVEETYYSRLLELSNLAASGKYNLSLMGIQPTYPSEKFGYIMRNDNEVSEFKEKPSEERACEYIKQGALWNGGVFAFKLGYVLDIAEQRFGTSEYDLLYKNYEELEKISFDYAVVEKENKIGLVIYDGAWNDLGTWNTLSEVFSDKSDGSAVVELCDNTHAINELSIPMVVLGVNNAVVAATPDGILVADKDKSSQLKNYVTNLRPMYERRQWGEYKVLDSIIQSDGHNSLIKHIVIAPGQHISYQYHHHRTEMWTIMDGEGELIIEDTVRQVRRGDSVTIPAETKHAIKANTELHIVEVQIGDELVEEDIHRLDYNWSNI